MSEREIRIEDKGIVHVLRVDEEGKPLKSKKIETSKAERKWWKYVLILFVIISINKLPVNDYNPIGIGLVELFVSAETIYIIAENQKISPFLKIVLYPLVLIGYWILFGIIGSILIFLISLVTSLF
ncbi:MAG: hypothetical protein Fur003_2220 [Candidatus Dojkabacteria bacterium]